MKHEKLLKEFIDGTLDFNKEKSLFNYMKSDSDLRAELRQFCAMALESQNSSDLSPSEASADKVFSQLGFENKRSQKKSLFWKVVYFFKNITPLAAALLSALLTSVIILTAVVPYLDGLSSEKNQNPAQTDSAKDMNNSYNYTYLMAGPIKGLPYYSKSEEAENQGIPIAADTVFKYLYVQTKPDTVYIYSPLEYDLGKTPVSLANTHENSNSTFLFNQQKNRQFDWKQIPYENHNYLSEEQDYSIYKPIGISIEFRGSSYWNIPYTYIQPDRYMNFKNTGLAVFYELADDFQIGGEIRQETFYQEYRDDIYIYKQQPNFLTGSLAFRYIPFHFGRFSNYYQITSGINRAGWSLRPMAGIKFQPYPDISFLLGLEYSYLNFHHNNESFGSHKAGLHYGITYNF